MVDRLTVSAEKAAEVLGIDMETFDLLVDTGIVPICTDFDGVARYSLIDLSEVLEWMNAKWRFRGGQTPQ